MNRYRNYVSHIFLFMTLSFMMLVASPVEAAFPIFGTSEEPDVIFEASDVTIDYDKVTIKGEFKNNTEDVQRVIGYTIQYLFYDEESSIIIDGAFKGENLSIEVGAEPVPYSVTVENKNARIRDVAHEMYGWKLQSSVKVEK